MRGSSREHSQRCVKRTETLGPSESLAGLTNVAGESQQQTVLKWLTCSNIGGRFTVLQPVLTHEPAERQMTQEEYTSNRYSLHAETCVHSLSSTRPTPPGIPQISACGHNIPFSSATHCRRPHTYNTRPGPYNQSLTYMLVNARLPLQKQRFAVLAEVQL